VQSICSIVLAGVIAGSLAVIGSGCGSSRRSETNTLNSAFQAPAPTVLTQGKTISVSSAELRSRGFQVACTSHGRRVTAESLPGQHVPTGKVISLPDGGPAIWIAKRADGSLDVSCR